jgi:HK97 gp10 family phage protein
MTIVSYQIKGGKELAALMAQLPIEVETKILRNGLKAGAKIIRDEARALAPKKTGEMAKSIKTFSGKSLVDGQVVVKIKLRGKHAFLGPFIEHGVLPHLIWVKSKESLAIHGVPIGKRVQHPGSAAKPFMRPALDNKAEEAIQQVGNYLTHYLSWGTITAPTVEVDAEEAA